ncbi:MAG: hypothetical protein ACREF0_19265, partial [Acetobacteraceae bacterium]
GWVSASNPIPLYAALGLAAASLSIGPALGASRSSTMEASATVVSSCTLTATSGARVESRCTRGERPTISMTGTPLPPAPLQHQAAQGGRKFLVVTY